MIDIQKKINELIKTEGLDRYELFFDEYSTYEEIPFFSRWSHISFLECFHFNKKNKILIYHAIELVNNIIKRMSEYLISDEIKEYFICLTITDWDDYKEINCLTPNIFISRRKSWILSCLKLKSKSTIEEHLINEYLSRLNIDGFDVFKTEVDDPENKSVFIISKFILKNDRDAKILNT